ncbi:putative rad21 rec8 n terminal domain-containing protein [Diplodia seriata]|uniref:Putative rad21 rec8 n terminal domain-containing protein n=1 Tax=Diplodia seriata TaxID=420778 RepID=A0A0G2GFS8_9PEZI|nr:putative rad21 rec8 n terminal domain-containing protein [Diplodia seriata]
MASRPSGLLVATLGSKSTTTKKVTRKAILNVDVPKAYGVTRVYSQQCSYVLADAQSTQNNIRAALVTVTKNIELDPEVGRTRPDQLVLEDDPSYLPDFALAPLDLDGSDLEPPSLTRSSSLSSLRHSRSPRRSISLEDQNRGSVFGIQVPSSDSGGFSGIVLGLGLGGVGAIVGNTGLAGPLDQFRGDALLLSLGIVRKGAKKKRAHQSADEQDKSDGDGRRVRPRSEEEEVGRGDTDMEDGGPVNVDEEEHDVEAAREAQSEQEERDLSQMFPWNVTASVRNSSLAPSARRALGFGGSGISTSAGGSIGGQLSSIGRRGRWISESPLHGRGRHHNLEPLPSSEADELGDDTLGDLGGGVAVGEDDEFEMDGAAAAVDTQTTTESQVARTAFAKEMENFGMFIFDSLKQKEDDAAAAAAEGSQSVESINEILFEDILPPHSTSSIVAAQGFMHLLTLSSLGRVSTRQDEPFGEIGLSLPYADEAKSVQ